MLCGMSGERETKDVGRVPLWATAVVALIAACGARSDLTGPGSGSNEVACRAAGEACMVDGDCCDLPCTGGACAAPPPPCLNDTGPVLLAMGLSDPYSLGGDATSLFVAELHETGSILRVPKAGGAKEVLSANEGYTDFLVVDQKTIFYATEHALRFVPTSGGAPETLATVFGPAGFHVGPDRIHLAAYLAEDLVAIDRGTGAKEVLESGMSGIHRVAVNEEGAYFSSFLDGLRRHRFSDGKLDVLGAGLGNARAVLAHGGDIYYTVPKTQRIYRVASGVAEPELLADLSSLGVFLEALVTDGAFLYTTVSAGDGGNGLVARVPIAGGAPQVVSDGGGVSPSALVVDDACVYFTERDGGSVFRARKAP
ncbi:Putative serine/threonine-protein kinase pknH [Minicystis rosea]|nr:Putative serine/threonine-protein kinase pknH [Minicystis rosea]